MVLKITGPRLKQAEYVRTPYRAEPEAGTAFETVLKPEYWSHVASKLRPGDKIEIMPEDMAWYAELLVVDCTALSARVAILLPPLDLDVSSEPTIAVDSHEVKWKGPQMKFVVIRKSDGAIVSRGHSKAEAEQWIEARVGRVVGTPEMDAA